MPSDLYNLIRAALVARESIVATYGGHDRELTPHVIGRAKNGAEQALFFQFGGGSRSGLRPDGQWRCLELGKLSNVAVDPDLEWHVGTSQGIRPQSCVWTVDVTSRR